MVWFYHEYLRGSPNSLIFFQSHYGLILSDRQSILGQEKESPFNPTMVWFYHVLRRCKTLYTNVLQLSIPLWSDFIMCLLANSISSLKFFQSHYGLILSDRQSILGQEKESPFNPTMVWFYHVLRRCKTLYTNVLQLSIPLWSDFIMCLLANSISSLKFFQSHYGLILSSYNAPVNVPHCATFNPTMVWFYRKTKIYGIQVKANFQSHYGLILSFRW